MPLYEYLCQDCEERVTLRRRMSDTTQPRCPLCGSEEMKRLISSVAVVTSSKDRSRDLSWVDKNVASRIKKKASTKLNPALQQTVDRMES
jgi:putative FmdB family regulatory protein